MAVLYYTGHIVYAIAIHTKEQMMLWLKTMINYAPIAPNPLTSDVPPINIALSSLPPVRLCPQLLQVPLGCAGVQPEVRELDQQSVQRGVQVSMATHHISEIMQCSVSRTATDSRDTVELGDYQQTVGWEVVNTKSRYSEVDT